MTLRDRHRKARVLHTSDETTAYMQADQLGDWVRVTFKATGEESRFFLPGSLAPERSVLGGTKKQRFITVDMEFSEPLRDPSVSVGHDGRFVHVKVDKELQRPVRSIISTYYDRPRNRKKILNRFWLFDEIPPGNMLHLLARFDRLFAVDTNTYSYRDVGRVSITSVMEGMVTRITKDHAASQGHYRYSAYRLNVAGNPEVLGWVELIDRLVTSLERNPELRIGLVVDSELDRLERINRRLDPVVEGGLLPRGLELIFASDSSASREYIPNKLISACHSATKQIRARLEEEKGWKRNGS